MNRRGPARPAMRYHGGKWRIAPWIISHFPPHRIYVEPFCGAASVLMRKPRSYAEVINDLDGDIVNLFEVLRDPGRADLLRRAVELTPWSRVEFDAAYHPAEDPVERARRTLIRGAMSHGTTSRKRNRTGFRAKAYRRNQAASLDWRTWPDQIPAFVDRLRGVTIECRDAIEVILQQDTAETLFYVDPPYLAEARSTVRSDGRSDRERAYAVDMDTGGHIALAGVLKEVDGAVVISGYATALYDVDLYGHWLRLERPTHADGGVERVEVLWLNARAARWAHAGQRTLGLEASA